MDKVVLPSRPRDSGDALTLAAAPAPSTLSRQPSSIENINSPQDALSVLKSKPDIFALRSCLDFLSIDETGRHSFHVRRPGPAASQIVFVLVNEIVPAYWQTLSQSNSQRKTWRRLIKCLRSAAGIAAVTNRLKILANPALQPTKADSRERQAVDTEHLQYGLELLECLLHGNDTLHFLCKDVIHLEPQEAKRAVIIDGLVALIAGGNLLSVAAQADVVVGQKSKRIRPQAWIGDGRQFSSWLGRNILFMSTEVDSANAEVGKYRASFLSKALRLGHKDHVMAAILSSPLQGQSSHLHSCNDILNNAPKFLQPLAVDIVLRLLAENYVVTMPENTYVSGAAALLEALIGDDGGLHDYLVEWLVELAGSNVGLPFGIFRAVIVLLSRDKQRMKFAFDQTLDRFGSKYSIQQEPLLQQELRTKVLLTVSGYMHRIEPEQFQQVKSTSAYLNAVSNRLAASTARLQFFGMVVGMAISQLVDNQDAALKFDTTEIKSAKGQGLRDLVNIKDTIGSVSDLQPVFKPNTESPKELKPSKSVSIKTQPIAMAGNSKIVAIEEIEDTESEDDLPVYAKPDSDPEDSDDDPTAINRNKATAPVYIRDLLAALRDEENYDRLKLAIEHAAPLIRRKTNFGTEVSDHIEDLAAKLLGLRDPYDFDDFHEKRLQAMVAIIVAKPVDMGKWFANTFFNGDWSMSQRAAILSALTLAARELAGLKDEDADMTGVNNVPDFPSKRLPEKYAKMFSLEAAPINKLTGKLERDIIKPMALEAADKATGPNVLKVRTFSSRMEVEKKRKRAIPNELAKIVADGFFYPLTGRMTTVMRARGDSSVFTSPFVLSHFLRTLALILSASGSSTLALPGMTTELWSLLLSLRRFALTEQSVLEALLFANLTLLEINSNDQRRLAEDHAKELMDTQAWVQPVFENLRGGPKEEERVKMLASALLVKVKEVIDNYQQSLLGPFAQR